MPKSWNHMITIITFESLNKIVVKYNSLEYLYHLNEDVICLSNPYFSSNPNPFL